MRIGIDCRTILHPELGEQAGVAHYTYYLVKNLLSLDNENTYVLFFDSRFKKTKEFEGQNVEIRHFPFYQYKKYLPITYSHILVSAYLNRERLDVYHSTFKNLPLTYKRPSVITVHDLALYKHPHLFPRSLVSREVMSMRVLTPQSLAKAAKIIAVSKNTKSDIIEEFGIPDERIAVVYEGVFDQSGLTAGLDLQTIKDKFGISDRFVLFLGTINPRKNVLGLINAFRNLRLMYNSPAKGIQLVIAGAAGWKSREVFKSIATANASILGTKQQRSGQERRRGFDLRSKAKKEKQGERRKNKERRLHEPIKHIGYVLPAEKKALMRAAVCFVFPSLYEGFGLPVLEAMSVGTPVVISRVGSLPEIAGRDRSALMVDPYKESEITDALLEILTDDGLRETLSIRGQKRAQDFNWQDCAEATLKIYHQVASGR